jgi:hypothetical protein
MDDVYNTAQRATVGKAHNFVRRGRVSRRATPVPQDGVSNGQQGSTLTTASPRPRSGPGHHCRVPKLPIKQLGASGGPCSGMAPGPGPDGEVTRGIPSRRRRRHSGPGGRGQDRSAVGCSILTPTPSPLRNKLADATGYPHPATVLRQANTLYTTAASAWRAPRVPLPTATSGKQRSLQSYARPYPQVSIRAGQSHDRCPIFHAGHAGSIPVARSTPSTSQNGGPSRSWEGPSFSFVPLTCH